MLVSKQEARKAMIEHPDSIHESRYELRPEPIMVQGFDNDKRHFQCNDTAFAILTVRLLFFDQAIGSPITFFPELQKNPQGFQAGGQRSKPLHISCKAPSPPPDPICPLY